MKAAVVTTTKTPEKPDESKKAHEKEAYAKRRRRHKPTPYVKRQAVGSTVPI